MARFRGISAGRIRSIAARAARSAAGRFRRRRGGRRRSGGGKLFGILPRKIAGVSTMLVLVAGAGYWLWKKGKLDQFFPPKS